jgi:hypothetical protein
MAITVGDIRRAIKGEPDETPFTIFSPMAGEAPEIVGTSVVKRGDVCHIMILVEFGEDGEGKADGNDEGED